MYNKRYAFVYSISYPDCESRKKEHKELCEVLLNSKVGRFFVEELIDQNGTVIRDRLKVFFRDKYKDDVLLIYFCCHGTIVNNSLILVTKEVTKDTSLDHVSIDIEFLKNLMNECDSENQVLILDCCLDSSDNEKLKDFDIINLFNFQKRGRIVLISCNLGEKANINRNVFEGNTSALFTRHFIEGIDTGRADRDMDGYITIDDIYNYTRKKISDEILKYRTNNKALPSQNPQLIPCIYGQSADIRIAINQYVPEERIEINVENMMLPLSENQKTHIDRALCQKFRQFQLRRVRIADGVSFEELGREAAKYLFDRIGNNEKIAVSCGRTLFETLSHLDRKSLNEITIFPLSVHPSTKIENVDSNILTALCMAKLSIADRSTNVIAYLLPYFAKSDGNISDESKLIIENILNDARNSDIFLLGIGNPLAPRANIEKFFQNAGLSFQDINKMGASGEIIYHLYDDNGQFLICKEEEDQKLVEGLRKYYNQFITLDLEILDEIRRRPGVDLIAVAGGREKHFSILGAIRAGLVRTLITDGETAKWLYRQRAGDSVHSGYFLGHETIACKIPFSSGYGSPIEPLVCPVEGCNETSNRRGECLKHNKDFILSSEKYSCPVEGCDKTSSKHGKCPNHNDDYILSSEKYSCPVEGCDKTSNKHGKCNIHNEDYILSS